MKHALEHLRACDPVLATLIDRVGPYTIELQEPGYETLVKAIVLQQLSGKVAEVIFRRLIEAAGNGRLTPEAVLRLRPRKLRAIGLSQRKTEYIRDLARRVVSGELDLRALAEATDEEVHARLTALRGIGPWTVHMFLIFALERPNVMPSGDLGIRVAVRNVYGLDQMPTPSEVDEIASKWRPYRTIASWYLWRSLEAKAGL
jgi:DNA-3-methyladenine glycosylase II